MRMFVLIFSFRFVRGKREVIPTEPPVLTQREVVVQGDGSYEEGSPVAVLVTAVLVQSVTSLALPDLPPQSQHSIPGWEKNMLWCIGIYLNQ